MANEWGVEPIGTSEEWGVAPAGTPKVSSTSPVVEKPSLLRRGLNIVGGAVAEIPQIAYEGVAGTVNAALPLWSNALALPEYVGGILAGGSAEEAANFANERIKANAAWEPMRPTLGEGSWLGRATGYIPNKLVEEGWVSPEDMNLVGKELAMLGAPKMFRSAGGAVSAGIDNLKTRARVAVPSGAVQAGEVWDRTGRTLPKSLPQGQAERAVVAKNIVEQRAADRALGKIRLPGQQDPYFGRQQLAAQRVVASKAVSTSERMLGETAVKASERGLEAVIPKENISPARHAHLSSQLESVGKESTLARLEADAMAELDKFSDVIPRGERPNSIIAGEQILKWLRGESDSGEKVKSGVRAVQNVFNKEYERFDTQKGAVAPTDNLQAALSASAETSAEAGHIIQNFVDLKQKVAGKLGKQLPKDLTLAEEAAGGVAGDTVLPPTLTLRQYRGLKSEFAMARDAATRNGKLGAAGEYSKLMEAARAGETSAARRLGPELAKQYGDVRTAYKNVLVKAFRKGHGGKLISYGDEVGDFRVAPAKVLDTLMDHQNASDFTLAAGAEEAAKLGRTLTGVSADELRVLGQENARTVVSPYIESMISEAYDKNGVSGVNKYLDANRDVLSTYGFDTKMLRSAAAKYDDAMARNSGAQLAVAKGVVDGVIGQTDSAKVGAYVFDHRSPTSAYKNLLGVSKDPAWKKSIDTLMIDELKSRIDGGSDIFSDPKTRAVAENIWSPKQVKAIEAYQNRLKRLSEKPMRYGSEVMPETGAEKGHALVQIMPVGFGLPYIIKGGVKWLLKEKIADNDAAAWSYIDAALVSPEKAQIMVDAFNGHKAAIARLKAGIGSEGRSMKKLALTSIKQVPGLSAAGAVSSAGRKPLPEMTDEELSAQ